MHSSALHQKLQAAAVASLCAVLVRFASGDAIVCYSCDSVPQLLEKQA